MIGQKTGMPSRRRFGTLKKRGVVLMGAAAAGGGLGWRLKLPPQRIARIAGGAGLAAAGIMGGVWLGRRMPGSYRNED